MYKLKHFIWLFSLLTVVWANAQQDTTVSNNIWYNRYQRTNPAQVTDFAIKADPAAVQRFSEIHYKYTAGGWVFIRCTPDQLHQLISKGLVDQVYFEPSRPQVLNDTMRLIQNVDSVYAGYAPLISPFTGKDVIIGYVDTGLDFNHPDFQNPDGSTRVLYYWDHSMGFSATTTPMKYGYGQVCDSASINAGTCPSLDNNAHGTTVAGTGSGNGLATGSFRGVAPESDIIIVETSFALPNWTLTVADAIDFVFSMADTLGKPAVVNTSVGDYLGSHDGLDPASLVIDSLLSDKPGRIVVAAAGNSGAQGKYHVKGPVNADTSFCWFSINPSSAFGTPAAYFDLWADTADFNNVYFAFAADNTSPTFEFRGRTTFYNIQDHLNTTVYDSIMVGPNKLAPIEFTTQLMDGVYHLELLIDSPDSANYLYRFETFGSGEYDLWSGQWMGLSDIKSSGLPLVSDFPAIAYYQYPDTLSTTVSSWTCSPKVVTVGNFKNQKDYIDYNGDNFVLSGGPVGQLTVNSSKGPNRLGYTKPDVAATGDGILSSCPLWLSANLITSNPSMLAQGGMHVRNGGTSMASPVIAGIAALYLEKCPTATYEDFITLLHQDAYEDMYTGITPNNGYGYGKVNAFHLLNQTNFEAHLSGDSLICADPIIIQTLENNFSAYLWQNGGTSPSIGINSNDTVFAIVSNELGCQAITDSIITHVGTVPTFPVINIIGGGLVTTTADSVIWYLNGNPLDDSNSPYYDPDTTGNYTVQVFSNDGCTFVSDPIFVDLSQIHELTQNEFVVFPNPFTGSLFLIRNEYYDLDMVVSDISGKVVYHYQTRPEDGLYITVDLNSLAQGTYVLSLYYEDKFKSYKVVKQ